MPAPGTPQQLDSEDGSGAQPRDDRVPAEPSRAKPFMRIQILAGGYVARHPALLTVLEGLGWHNPGDSMNP